MRFFWLLLFPALTGPAIAQTGPPATHAGHRTLTLSYRGPEGPRTRAVDVWYPTRAAPARVFYSLQRGTAARGAALAPGKHPVVLFSHGYLGMGSQSVFLTESLARAGYIVLAPTHADSLMHKGKRLRRGFPRFAQPKTWTTTDFADRRQDLLQLLKHAGTLDWLARHLDSDRIAVSGHSLGGYTALGLVGAWPTKRDARLKAALALSPYITPYVAHGHAKSIAVPTMLQGGTLDFGITPFLPDLYKRMPKTRYLLVIRGANHYAWVNAFGKTATQTATTGQGKLVVDYAIAFFDRHLRGRKAPRLDTAAPGLSRYTRD